MGKPMRPMKTGLLAAGLSRALVGRTLMQTVVRGFGGAVLAGFGWRVGADMYEAFKRRWSAPRRADDDNPKG